MPMKSVVSDAQEIIGEIDDILENYDFLADFDMKSLLERVIACMKREESNYNALKDIIDIQRNNLSVQRAKYDKERKRKIK